MGLSLSIEFSDDNNTWYPVTQYSSLIATQGYTNPGDGTKKTFFVNVAGHGRYIRISLVTSEAWTGFTFYEIQALDFGV